MAAGMAVDIQNLTDFLGRSLQGILGNRILVDNELKRALIKIENGKISEVIKDPVLGERETDLSKFLDVKDLVVMPGIFDTHVHVNEPGRTEWEGYATATKAALAGGVTTIIDMPLNSIPPTTTLENLEVKLKTAEGKCYTDVGFWGGVIPGNSESLQPMIKRGVIGFKCFLIHSGVDEFPCVSEEEVSRALAKINGTDAVLAFHAEVDCGHENTEGDPHLYKSFLESRPDEMELRAIQLIDRQLRNHRNVRCHIVHLSSAKALPVIAKLKADGLPITVETCPHYLTLNSDEILEKQTQFKCCPPIRGEQNQIELWKGLEMGIIDMIVSDHSPCTPELKKSGEQSFMQAWGGISSVQFGLPNIWTKAKSRGLGVPQVSRWMSSKPAHLAGFSNRKGKIETGFDADFVIWNDEETFTVTSEDIHHKHKITPYLGKTLTGKVRSTIIRGQVVYANASFATACGELLVT